LPRPRLLILNYPHNPTAELATVDFFKEIVAIAKKYRFMVIHDFAYAKIAFDGYKPPSFLEAPGARDVGVEFGSFSKTYNFANWAQWNLQCSLCRRPTWRLHPELDSVKREKII
jgi:alanine-synthesizing transaminase